MMRPTMSIADAFVVAVGLSLLIQTVSARRSLGGGSGLSSWSTNEDEGLFAGAGRGARDAQRRDALSRMEWVIDPLDADAVKSAIAVGEGAKECADVVCKYLGGKDPLRVKLRTRPVKKGTGGEPGDAFRAVAIVSSRSPKKGGGIGLSLPLIGPTIKRVKATWSTSGPRLLGTEEQKSSPFMKMDYDSASLTAHGRMEVEVTLPRVRKTGKNPTVVYTFPVSEGNLGSPSTYIPASSGMVKVFPDGRVKKVEERDGFQVGVSSRDAIQAEEEEGGVDVGTAALHAAAGQGLVDPTWAKGRPVWRKGRRVGVL